VKYPTSPFFKKKLANSATSASATGVASTTATKKSNRMDKDRDNNGNNDNNKVDANTTADMIQIHQLLQCIEGEDTEADMEGEMDLGGVGDNANTNPISTINTNTNMNMLTRTPMLPPKTNKNLLHRTERPQSRYVIFNWWYWCIGIRYQKTSRIGCGQDS